MKTLARIAAALALVAGLGFIGSGVNAQAASTLITANLTISWTAPTVDSTGAAITSVEAPTSYQIYISGTTTMPATPSTTVTASPATYSISTGAGSTSYVSVAACNAFGCGALSSPTAITASGNPPGVPTAIKVTVSLASS
jgi:hypothetical protein